MTISQAIQSAMSGLQAAQTQAAIVSQNIANAQTEGYVRKDVNLGNRIVNGVGMGVEVQGISRKVDEYLIRDMRIAAASVGRQDVLSASLTVFTDLVGQPQDERSLASALGKLDRALQELGNAPEDATLQKSAVAAAEALISSFQTIDRGVQKAREDADSQIDSIVRNVNSSLHRIDDLNRQIASQASAGIDTSDLRDERDRLLDSLARDLPINVIQSGHNVVVMTKGGVTLLDNAVHELSFQTSAIIPANSAYVPPPAASPLSGLMVDGVDISFSSTYPGAIREGTLAGLFEIRDSIMPLVQKQADELAAHVAAAFQAADATVTGAPPADTGLFTDNGGPVDPLAYVPGLAGRLSVNGLVEANAALLRDGVHATAAGAAGDPTQIHAFQAIFSQTFSFDPGAGLQTAAKLAEFAASATADIQKVRSEADRAYVAQSLVLSGLSNTRLNRDGVNIDDEMQKMLSIERSYAASAQVISMANAMLDSLFEAMR
jgi:flagellar hook-associated protein 1 FlgK